jgi:hypothetical protein
VSRFLVLALGALLVSACGGDDGHSCSGCLADSQTPSDASSDATAPTDAPVTSGCPAGFASIAGGQGAHRYKLINSTDDWSEQRGKCAAMSSSAYLAIPDDATELGAIATLSAASASWVGISDTATEGAFVTVKGVAATFLPWDGGQPDNAGPQGEDCVMIQTSSSKLRDEKCGTKYRAVCECEP